MNRLLMVLAVASLSAFVLAEERVGTPDGSANETGQVPLMVSFSELKWTALPERKGMQFCSALGRPDDWGVHADA